MTSRTNTVTSFHHWLSNLTRLDGAYWPNQYLTSRTKTVTSLHRCLSKLTRLDGAYWPNQYLTSHTKTVTSIHHWLSKLTRLDGAYWPSQYLTSRNNTATFLHRCHHSSWTWQQLHDATTDLLADLTWPKVRGQPRRAKANNVQWMTTVGVQHRTHWLTSCRSSITDWPNALTSPPRWLYQPGLHAGAVNIVWTWAPSPVGSLCCYRRSQSHNFNEAPCKQQPVPAVLNSRVA